MQHVSAVSLHFAIFMIFIVMVESLHLESVKLKLAASDYISHQQKLSAVEQLKSETYCTNEAIEICYFENLSASLKMLQTPEIKIKTFINKLQSAGFCNTDELISFAKDFLSRPEVISEIFQKDFGFLPFEAHKLRVALLSLVKGDLYSADQTKQQSEQDLNMKSSLPTKIINLKQQTLDGLIGENTPELSKEYPDKDESKAKQKFKKVIVSSAAKLQHTARKSSDSQYSMLKTHSVKDADVDWTQAYPALASSLTRYYRFMTEPSPFSQEPSIRKATADVYMRHAHLFLGWVLQFPAEAELELNLTNEAMKSIDISDIFASKEKEASTPVFRYIVWLRKHRSISASYEANLLRGLTKLAKFRFCTESTTEYGSGKSYEDIPVIKELRKLHREANKAQAKAPSVSDEALKWLSWPEYLDVVQKLKCDLRDAMLALRTGSNSVARNRQPDNSSESRISSRQTNRGNMDVNDDTDENDYMPDVTKQKFVNPIRETDLKAVATMFQRYLLLAIMSCVPDRQRTFRELRLQKTFMRFPALPLPLFTPGDSSLDKEQYSVDVAVTSFLSSQPYVDQQAHWAIMHGPEDYKTGGSYGSRPPLPLPTLLTPAVDNFVLHWRRYLNPVDDHLFVQPRGGRPLTQDSVYQIVCRACFEKAGKRTNPHLLRDMIVTHVRNSDASEKQLEALALFMGHSIAMQRTSYDRRTLSQKVAPATNLLADILKDSMKIQ